MFKESIANDLRLHIVLEEIILAKSAGIILNKNKEYDQELNFQLIDLILPILS